MAQSITQSFKNTGNITSSTPLIKVSNNSFIWACPGIIYCPCDLYYIVKYGNQRILFYCTCIWIGTYHECIYL